MCQVVAVKSVGEGGGSMGGEKALGTQERLYVTLRSLSSLSTPLSGPKVEHNQAGSMSVEGKP